MKSLLVSFVAALCILTARPCRSSPTDQGLEIIKKGFEELLNGAIDGIGVGSSSSIDPRLPNIPLGDINDLVDKIFVRIRKNVTAGGLDPIRFPSDSDDFTVTLFNRSLSGQIEFANARLGGFGKIHRTGDCTNTAKPGRAIELLMNIGGNDILIGFDFSLGVGILGANIKVQLVVEHVDLLLQVLISKLDGRQATLTDFQLKEIGRVQFDIGGIPFGGSERLSSLLTTASNLFKDSLIYAFQEALRPVIQGILDQVIQPPALM